MEPKGSPHRPLANTAPSLSQALNQSVAWKLMPYNVSQSVKAPRKPWREPRFPTPDQVGVLLERVRDTANYAVIHLAVYRGFVGQSCWG